MSEGLEIREIPSESVPNRRSRVSSEVYDMVLKKVDSSKTGAIEIDASTIGKKAKSFYWGMSLHLKKNELRGKYHVSMTKDSDTKVYLKKL